MRIFVLSLLGASALMAAGCSSSRSLSRQAVMADHIATTTPSGRTVSAPVRRVATTTRYMPTPPPPPALPATATPVARAPYASTVARPVARPAARVRSAPRRATVLPRRRVAVPKKKGLFGSTCFT